MLIAILGTMRETMGMETETEMEMERAKNAKNMTVRLLLLPRLLLLQSNLLLPPRPPLLPLLHQAIVNGNVNYA
jgi:hypothetical protein